MPDITSSHIIPGCSLVLRGTTAGRNETHTGGISSASVNDFVHLGACHRVLRQQCSQASKQSIFKKKKNPWRRATVACPCHRRWEGERGWGEQPSLSDCEGKSRVKVTTLSRRGVSGELTGESWALFILSTGALRLSDTTMRLGPPQEPGSSGKQGSQNNTHTHAHTHFNSRLFCTCAQICP